MSLGLIVLRNLTRLALSGRTIAGDAVGSSALASIEEFDADGDARPTITIYADRMQSADADRQEAAGAMSLASTDLKITLALEIACLARGKLEGADYLEIPEADEGLEITIDLIQYAAIAELDGGQTKWAKLWREFVSEKSIVDMQRAASSEQSGRFAARRLELSVSLSVRDPVPGQDIEGLWLEIVDAFKGDADATVKNLGDMIEAVVAVDPERADWSLDQARLGLSDTAARAISLAPFITNPVVLPGSPIPVTTEITVDDADAPDAPPLVVTPEEEDE